MNSNPWNRLWNDPRSPARSTRPAMRLAPLLAAALSGVAGASDWPGWRGPGGSGVSRDTGFPERWKDAKEARENIAWKLETPGWGNSSAAIVGERLYFTSQTDDKALHVVAVDRARGAVAWSRQVGSGMLKAHDLHNMATPTPAAEGDRVWALFGTGDLLCLDAAGDVVWKRNLAADHGDYTILWGMGSSPCLAGDRLVVVCMHRSGSYVLALDKHTGKEAWKKARDLPCTGEATDSYSSPILSRARGRSELVVAGADHVNAYDPVTGAELWVSSGLKIQHEYGRSIASPTAGEGVVIAASSNYGGLGRVIAVEAGGEGDVSASRRLWSYEKNSPDCPTPLVYDGLVYLVRDNGVGSCLAVKTGEVKWSKRLCRGDVKASPVAADGRIYVTSVDGTTVVVEAGAEGKVVAESSLDATVIATPALADGVIYLRARERLYAIGGKKG